MDVRSWWRAKLRLIVVVPLLGTAGWALGSDPSGGSRKGVAFNVRIRDWRTALAVTDALSGANRRLGKPGCEQLLAEFKDVGGRPLTDVLAGLGQTSRGYLSSVFFYDGSEHPGCARHGVAAATFPRSHVVFICPAFADLEAHDRRAGETLIIHEMLHSLGLGEDPPSSLQITSRVFRQCR